MGQSEIRGHVETIDAEAAAPMNPPVYSAQYSRLSGTQLFWARNRRRIQHEVFERDKGFCVRCGVDCGAVRVAMDLAIATANGNYAIVLRGLSLKYRMPEETIERRRILWDCDHVVPMAKNGSMFDIANLQTLCVPCHRRKSRLEWEDRFMPGQLSLFPDFEAIVTP